LVGALLAVDFFAERALREDYAGTAFAQLAAIAHIAQARPPHLTAIPPSNPEEISGLQKWTAEMAASGARITVITQPGLVLADSQSDPRTMENHAERPEIRDALATGQGQSTRHSVTIGRDLLYYAVKQNVGADSPVVLRFAIPLATIQELLGSFRRSLWLATFIILLLGGAAALLISRGLSRRIDRLTQF